MDSKYDKKKEKSTNIVHNIYSFKYTIFHIYYRCVTFKITIRLKFNNHLLQIK
jgi:hypothetical protein